MKDRRMVFSPRALRWLRDAAIGLAVLTAAVTTLGAITGQAYAGLPIAVPGNQAPSGQQVADPNPHGAEPACAACHRSHTAPEDTLLVAANGDNAICTRCHSAGGEAPVSTHANVNYAFATQPAFSLTCALCHDPHGDPNRGNRAMVRSSIAGLPVAFAGSAGADSFDDGLDDGTHDSICVVCHTTTSHNNAFSAELIGQGHGPVGSDCTSCHKHGDDPAVLAGFMPDGLPPTHTATASATSTVAPTETATQTPPPVPTDTPPAVPTMTTEPMLTATPTPSALPTDTPDVPPATPQPSATPPP